MYFGEVGSYSKSAGPDDIPSCVLKLCAAEVSPFLQFIFTQSLNEGTLPSDWLKANITPIHKKGDRSVPANYRPISLTSASMLQGHGTHNFSLLYVPLRKQ